MVLVQKCHIANNNMKDTQIKKIISESADLKMSSNKAIKLGSYKTIGKNKL